MGEPMSPIATVVLSIVLGAPGKDNLTPELQAIQGEWQAVSVEEKGTEWGKDETREVVIEIVRDVLIYRRSTPIEKFRIVRLDVSEKPAQIDLRLIAEGVDPQTACHAIYGIDGGRLKLCLSHEFKANEPDERPKDFKTGDKRPPLGRLLFIMERIKK